TAVAVGPPAGYRGRRCRARPRIRLVALLLSDDTACEEGGIVVDEAEQGRTTGVLPRQAHEIKTGNVGDPAPVDYRPVVAHAGDGDPGVVGAVAGRPDHHVHAQAGAVGEPDGAPVRGGHPWPEPDSSGLEPAAAAADDEIPARHPAAQPGVGGDPHQPEPG